MHTPLVEILELEQLDNNLFRSQRHCENFRNTLYGGQVLGQALRACCHTVEDSIPNSLHAYFLRPGTSETPVIYDVENMRDGRSFSSRRCVARQNGRPIFTMSASFHKEEEGFSHQIAFPKGIQKPDQILAENPNPFSPIKEFDKEEPFGLFSMIGIEQEQDFEQQVDSYFWIKCNQPLPKDPTLNYCALAFISDMGLLSTALTPHNPSIFDGNVFAASIDHAMWFHESSLRADEWLLCKNISPWAGNARGFAHANIYNEAGQMIASTAQEGLIRKLD